VEASVLPVAGGAVHRPRRNDRAVYCQAPRPARSRRPA